jgi:hypothetical protein
MVQGKIFAKSYSSQATAAYSNPVITIEKLKYSCSPFMKKVMGGLRFVVRRLIYYSILIQVPAG